MPVYTYRCDTCGRQVDDIRPLQERNAERPCCDDPDNAGPDDCPGVLQRYEAAEVNANMGHMWQP